MWAEPVDSGFVAAAGAAMLYKFSDAACQMAALCAKGLTAYSRQLGLDVSEKEVPFIWEGLFGWFWGDRASP